MTPHCKGHRSRSIILHRSNRTVLINPLGEGKVWATLGPCPSPPLVPPGPVKETYSATSTTPAAPALYIAACPSKNTVVHLNTTAPYRDCAKQRVCMLAELTVDLRKKCGSGCRACPTLHRRTACMVGQEIRDNFLKHRTCRGRTE
jgi:hypothetical protein